MTDWRILHDTVWFYRQDGRSLECLRHWETSFILIGAQVWFYISGFPSPKQEICAALSAVMLLYLWGSCIAYLVIIGDSFSPLLKMALGSPHNPNIRSQGIQKLIILAEPDLTIQTDGTMYYEEVMLMFHLQGPVYPLDTSLRGISHLSFKWIVFHLQAYLFLPDGKCVARL